MPTAWGCDGQRHRDRDGTVTGPAEQSTAIAGSWHSCTSLVTPRDQGTAPLAPAAHFQLLKNCLKKGVSQPWDRISTFGDRDRDWEGVMAPMSALGHPSPPAPTCVWGGGTMRVITSSATLRATWRSHSLSLHLAERDVSHSGQSLSPCHPMSPSLSTFPSC